MRRRMAAAARRRCCDCGQRGRPGALSTLCPDDPRIVRIYGAREAIATSSGQNDSGLFELNFRDERYLPFEYMGAVSRWRIELPPENNYFDLDTLTDVVLHLNYTAREGGEALREAALHAAALQAARATAGRSSTSATTSPTPGNCFGGSGARRMTTKTTRCLALLSVSAAASSPSCRTTRPSASRG